MTRFKFRVLLDDWNYANTRARESYIRRHGANEEPTPGIRVIDRNQLRRERYHCVRTSPGA